MVACSNNQQRIEYFQDFIFRRKYDNYQPNQWIKWKIELTNISSLAKNIFVFSALPLYLRLVVDPEYIGY